VYTMSVSSRGAPVTRAFLGRAKPRMPKNGRIDEKLIAEELGRRKPQIACLTGHYRANFGSCKKCLLSQAL
jgi:hypothetical protein